MLRHVQLLDNAMEFSHVPGNVWDPLPKKDLSLEYFCDLALGGFTLAYPVVRRLWTRLFSSRQALTR